MLVEHTRRCGTKMQGRKDRLKVRAQSVKQIIVLAATLTPGAIELNP